MSTRDSAAVPAMDKAEAKAYAELTEAEKELRTQLRSFFANVAAHSLPSTPVAFIDHFGYAEDGKTLVAMLTLADGRTGIFSAMPGTPATFFVCDTGGAPTTPVARDE